MKLLRASAFLWLIGLAAVAGWFALNQSAQIEAHDLTQALHPGYDAFGRNCFKLTLVAAWRSFMSLIPMSLYLVTVSLLLSFARFWTGHWFDLLFRSALDTISSLPGLLIALAISAFFEEQHWAFILACAISLVPYLIRFYEGQINELRSRAYFQSTIAVGATPVHLYLNYIVPELLTATASVYPFLMTRLILIETSFSFLGIQSLVPGETWGRLLYQGKDYLLEAPWIIAAVGAPLFLTLLAFHLLSNPERN